MSDRKVTLFDVGNYNYGGLTMALAVADLLGEDKRNVAIANGAAVGPLRASGFFSQVLDLAGDAHNAFLTQAANELGVRRVLQFGISRKSSRRICLEACVPLFMFEMHLWRRRAEWLKEICAEGARLVLEGYPTIEDDLDRVGLTDGRRLVLPPLVGRIRRSPAAERSETIVVSLGGAQSPYVDCAANSYPTLISAILDRALPRLGRAGSLLVCCGEAMAQHLNATARWTSATVRYLPRARYLDVTSRARLVLAQPSIHTPYEVFLAGVPTILLPPQNFTQCFHLRQWKAWGFGIPGTNLTDLCGDLVVDPHGDEATQEARIQAAFRALLSEGAALDRPAGLYAEAIEAALGDGGQVLLRRQADAVRRLGAPPGEPELAAMLSHHPWAPGSERDAERLLPAEPRAVNDSADAKSSDGSGDDAA